MQHKNDSLTILSSIAGQLILYRQLNPVETEQMTISNWSLGTDKLMSWVFGLLRNDAVGSRIDCKQIIGLYTTGFAFPWLYSYTSVLQDENLIYCKTFYKSQHESTKASEKWLWYTSLVLLGYYAFFSAACLDCAVGFHRISQQTITIKILKIKPAQWLI